MSRLLVFPCSWIWIWENPLLSPVVFLDPLNGHSLFEIFCFVLLMPIGQFLLCIFLVSDEAYLSIPNLRSCDIVITCLIDSDYSKLPFQGGLTMLTMILELNLMMKLSGIICEWNRIFLCEFSLDYCRKDYLVIQEWIITMSGWRTAPLNFKCIKYRSVKDEKSLCLHWVRRCSNGDSPFSGCFMILV